MPRSRGARRARTLPEGQRSVPGGTRPERGQGLAEFAIVIPFLVVLFMGVIEFALAMGATLGVNRASQNAAHVAASAGALAGADCLILRRIEQELGVPNDAGRIQQVVISRQAMAGNVTYAQQTWYARGSTDCVMADGTTSAAALHAHRERLSGSAALHGARRLPAPDPARSTVDNVGVQIRYEHDWVTPLEGAMGLIGERRRRRRMGLRAAQHLPDGAHAVRRRRCSDAAPRHPRAAPTPAGGSAARAWSSSRWSCRSSCSSSSWRPSSASSSTTS